MHIVCESERLLLRRPVLADAPFFLRLLNQQSWLSGIGDHEVYSLAQAAEYIIDGPQAMYVEHGFALAVCLRKSDGAELGLCGIVKRDGLPLPDLGFAFLDEFTGQGYAREAARASLEMARDVLGMPTMLALARPENARSIRLLTLLGFQLRGPLTMHEGEAPVLLFECSLLP